MSETEISRIEEPDTAVDLTAASSWSMEDETKGMSWSTLAAMGRLGFADACVPQLEIEYKTLVSLPIVADPSRAEQSPHEEIQPGGRERPEQNHWTYSRAVEDSLDETDQTKSNQDSPHDGTNDVQRPDGLIRETVMPDGTRIKEFRGRPDGMTREQVGGSTESREFTGRPDGMTREQVNSSSVSREFTGREDGMTSSFISSGREVMRFKGRADGQVCQVGNVNKNGVLMVRKDFEERADGMIAEYSQPGNGGGYVSGREFRGRADGLIKEEISRSGVVNKQFKGREDGMTKSDIYPNGDVIDRFEGRADGQIRQSRYDGIVRTQFADGRIVTEYK